MTDIVTPTAPLTSRAVRRRVEAGSMTMCANCRTQVKFAAKQQRFQVIANVYTDGHWDRVEHFHDECYDESGAPYGTAVDQPTPQRRAASN
jgi:hypothetical protein